MPSLFTMSQLHRYDNMQFVIQASIELGMTISMIVIPSYSLTNHRVLKLGMTIEAIVIPTFKTRMTYTQFVIPFHFIFSIRYTQRYTYTQSHLRSVFQVFALKTWWLLDSSFILLTDFDYTRVLCCYSAKISCFSNPFSRLQELLSHDLCSIIETLICAVFVFLSPQLDFEVVA